MDENLLLRKTIPQVYIEKPVERSVVVQLFTKYTVRAYRKSAINSCAFNRHFFWGGVEERSTCCCKNQSDLGCISSNTELANALMVRIGWFLGTRFFGERQVKINPDSDLDHAWFFLINEKSTRDFYNLIRPIRTFSATC